ncbi:MAG: hypothetical protein ACRDQ0_05880 [Pseudonocardia sp.]
MSKHRCIAEDADELFRLGAVLAVEAVDVPGDAGAHRQLRTGPVRVPGHSAP